MKAESHAAPLSGLFDGTLALLWAILASGIEDYCRGIRLGRVHSREFRSARAWIFGRREALTGFESLCSVFDLDASKIRSLLLAFERTHGRQDVSIASLLRTRSCSPGLAAFGDALREFPLEARAELEP